MHGASCSRGCRRNRPRYEVADLARSAAHQLLHSHVLTPEQQRVLSDITRCRTAALGGHLEVCRDCGLERPVYDSCSNRHCPKCQALAAQRWLDRRLDRLLDTHYFHVTFTLPAELRGFARGHPQLVYDLLFQAATSTLLELGRDPHWLGAQLGITAVLHTWSRKLHWHPHVHCVVSGGGLSLDQQRWLSAPPDFLFPVKVAGALFRGKFLDALADQLDPSLRDQLYRCRWIVDCRPPFGSAEHVLRYLGRYTHRVGISNHRLLRVSDGTVTFRTRHRQSETCSVVEFLRRFLGHVLPRGFVRIRHYGLLASRNVPTRLAQAQRCVLAGKAFTPRRLRRRPADWRSWFRQLTGVDLRRCPRCGHHDLERRPLPRARPPPCVQVTS